MQASEWQLECEVKGGGRFVWLHKRHFPPEAGIFVQPYHRWAGGCMVPLGLGPDSGVTMGNLLHSPGVGMENTGRGGIL